MRGCEDSRASERVETAVRSIEKAKDSWKQSAKSFFERSKELGPALQKHGLECSTLLFDVLAGGVQC